MSTPPDQRRTAGLLRILSRATHVLARPLQVAETVGRMVHDAAAPGSEDADDLALLCGELVRAGELLKALGRLAGHAIAPRPLEDALARFVTLWRAPFEPLKIALAVAPAPPDPNTMITAETEEVLLVIGVAILEALQADSCGASTLTLHADPGGPEHRLRIALDADRSIAAIADAVAAIVPVDPRLRILIERDAVILVAPRVASGDRT